MHLLLLCWRSICFNPSQVQFTPKLDKENLGLYYQFQSLTGSIHTKTNLPLPLLSFSRFNPSQVQFTQFKIIFIYYISLRVSIPHRFNSHLHFRPHKIKPIQVSIPHRFNSHTHLKKRMNFIFKEFQSLTGSIHTKIYQACIEFDLRVSIPHRFNSHTI